VRAALAHRDTRGLRCRATLQEVRARANWTFRAPRPPLGRPAPAVRRHAQARARSECGRPLRRGHRRWPRGSWLASRRRSDVRRPICTWWSIPAAAAHRPRGMGSVFGTNSRATRRAGELAAADPAHRSRLGGRLELAARSRPEIWPCGAPFGHEAERALVRGNLVGCWGHPMGRTASRGARERNTSPKHRTSAAPLREHHRGVRSQIPSSGPGDARVPRDPAPRERGQSAESRGPVSSAHSLRARRRVPRPPRRASPASASLSPHRATCRARGAQYQIKSL